jgi:predicted nucleic acid-binding protein
MAWLLDTNVLSEGRKPRPEPRVTAFYGTQPLDQLYISVVNIAEIRFGIELQEEPVRRAELTEWLTLTLRPTFAGRILPVTEDIMLKSRLLMEDDRKVGHTYSYPDLVLAATALHHGFTVVTRDGSDFDKARVPVFNPWETQIPPCS